MKKLSIILSLVLVSLTSFGFIMMKKSDKPQLEEVQKYELVVKKESLLHKQEAGI